MDAGRGAGESIVLELQAQDLVSSAVPPSRSSSHVDTIAAGDQLLSRESPLQHASSGGNALAKDKQSPVSSGGLSAANRPAEGSDSHGDSKGGLVFAAAPAAASMLSPGGWLQQRRVPGDGATVPALNLASPAEDGAPPGSDRPGIFAAYGAVRRTVDSDGLPGGAVRAGLTAVSAGTGAVPPLHAAALDRATTTTSASFLESVLGDAGRAESDVCALEAFGLGSRGSGASPEGVDVGATLAKGLHSRGSTVREASDLGAPQLQEVPDGGEGGEEDGSVESGGVEDSTAVEGGAASVSGSDAVLGNGDAAEGTCFVRSVWAAWAGGDDEISASSAFGGIGGDPVVAVQTGSDRTPDAPTEGADDIDALAGKLNDESELRIVPGGPADSTVGKPPTASPVTDTDDVVAAVPPSAAAGAAAAVAPSPSTATAENKPVAGVLDRVAATPVPVGALLGAVWSAPPSWVGKPKAATRGGGLGFHRTRVGVGRADWKQSVSHEIRQPSVPEGSEAAATEDEEAGNGDTPGRAGSHADTDSPVVPRPAKRSPASASETLDVDRRADGGDAKGEETRGEKGLAPAVEEASSSGAEAVVGADPRGGDDGGAGSQGEETCAAVVHTPPFLGAAEPDASAPSPASFSAWGYSEQDEVSVAGDAVSTPRDGSDGPSEEPRSRPIAAGDSSEQADASADASAEPDVPPTANAAGSVPTGDGAAEALSRKETVSPPTNSYVRVSMSPPWWRPDGGGVDVAATTAAAAAATDQEAVCEVEALATEVMVTIPGGEEDGTSAASSGADGIDEIGDADGGLGDASGDAGASPEADALQTGGADQGMVKDSDVDGFDDVVVGSGGNGGGGGGDGGGSEAPGEGGGGEAVADTADTLAIGGEVPTGATLSVLEKEKKQEGEGDDEAQEESAQGEQSGIVSDSEEVDKEKEAGDAGSKGWWARASDRRRAKVSLVDRVSFYACGSTGDSRGSSFFSACFLLFANLRGTTTGLAAVLHPPKLLNPLDLS